MLESRERVGTVRVGTIKLGTATIGTVTLTGTVFFRDITMRVEQSVNLG